MIAGTLEIQMLANMAQLTSDMEKAKGIVGDAVRSIEKILGALGLGFGASELLDKINSVAEGMDKLMIASEKTGTSVENLSKLQFFAGTAGSNIDSVSTALAKLSKAEAASGNDTAPATQALVKLGLSARDAAGNLKQPGDLYGEIAQKLYGYADGAGKSAIAQALMGKAGAEQLPTMKAMVEIGDVQAITTTAQAQAAKEYIIELARLDQQKQLLWQTVVSALLPSMQTFVGVLLDAAKQTDSLQSRAKSLAADGSITSWADAAAMGAARFIDVLKVIPMTLDVIMSSFKAAQADLELLPKHMAIIASYMTPGGLSKKEGDAAYKELLDEQDRLTVESNAKMVALYNADKTEFSRAVAAKIQLRKDAEAFKATEQGVTPDKPQLDFRLGDAAKAAAELKLYQSTVKTLENEIGKLNGTTAAGKYQFEMYGMDVTTTDGKIVHLQGNLEKLSPPHKAMIALLAQEDDARKVQLELLKNAITLMEAENKVYEAQSAVRRAAAAADSDALDQMRFTTSLIGQTVVAQGHMNDARTVEVKLRGELRTLDNESIANAAQLAQTQAVLQAHAADATKAANTLLDQAVRANEVRRIELKLRSDLDLAAGIAAANEAQYGVTRKTLADAATKQTTDAIALLDVRTAKERSWETGANSVFMDYVDHATNAAEAAKTAFGNAFKGMEDALVKFAQTGKLDFKTLADSIIADIIRIQVRQNITGPLAANMGGAMSWLGNLLGPSTQAAAPVAELAFAATGGPVTAGSPYVVGEAGPEMFVPKSSGNIIPNNQLGGGTTVNNVFYLSGAVDSRSQAQIAAAAGQGVARAMARNT